MLKGVHAWWWWDPGRTATICPLIHTLSWNAVSVFCTGLNTKVNHLCWFLYSNRAAERENLTPTSGSLDTFIRSHDLEKSQRKSPSTYSRPAAFGSTSDAGLSYFCPVCSLHSPAAEAVLHLIKWGCKLGCERVCSRRNNNVPCTEMCGCLLGFQLQLQLQPGITDRRLWRFRCCFLAFMNINSINMISIVNKYFL